MPEYEIVSFLLATGKGNEILNGLALQNLASWSLESEIKNGDKYVDTFTELLLDAGPIPAASIKIIND